MNARADAGAPAGIAGDGSGCVVVGKAGPDGGTMGCTAQPPRKTAANAAICHVLFTAVPLPVSPAQCTGSFGASYLRVSHRAKPRSCPGAHITRKLPKNRQKGSAMFTIEHDFDATVITLVDELPQGPNAEARPLNEDVIIQTFDDRVVIEQFDPDTQELSQVVMTIEQLDELRAALNLPEGNYRLDRR